MSGRWRRGWRSAAVAAGALALLAACTTGAKSDAAASAPPIAGSPPPPIGSITHPRPVECIEGTTYPPPGTAAGSGGGHPPSSTSPASPVPPAPPASPAFTDPVRPPASKDDVTVGPVTWHGLGALAAGDQTARGIHNSEGWHYPVNPDIMGAVLVTMTVGAEERASAGLEYGIGYGLTPAPAVTFHGCPGGGTVFRGTVFVAGDGRACVPLDIRIGDGPTRRVVISFFHGRCPA
ncbi:hypothetical protein OG552_29180 [Streptomyces sp. NBC_01476]|uniref:hypothetical protein n=1 Tax=Streptomyces sp. NBC_01476 TaxID=2903881 RepID=UPI002E3539E9|nr:hypothetical protein [Streptomyces sp. NBC_01476]